MIAVGFAIFLQMVPFHSRDAGLLPVTVLEMQLNLLPSSVWIKCVSVFAFKKNVDGTHWGSQRGL